MVTLCYSSNYGAVMMTEFAIITKVLLTRLPRNFPRLRCQFLRSIRMQTSQRISCSQLDSFFRLALFSRIIIASRKLLLSCKIRVFPLLGVAKLLLTTGISCKSHSRVMQENRTPEYKGFSGIKGEPFTRDQVSHFPECIQMTQIMNRISPHIPRYLCQQLADAFSELKQCGAESLSVFVLSIASLRECSGPKARTFKEFNRHFSPTV